MRKNKKQRRIMFLLILILGITIGFALLSTTLYINGTAEIKSNTWNIHWDDTSVNVTQGSVSATAPSVTTATSTKDTVSFDVEFEMPGDFYEFEIDAINEGSVDGALELSQNWITYKSNNVETTLPSYMDFKVTYDDGTTVPATGDVLAHGQSQTYKIRVEFKSGVEELPDNPQPITIEVTTPYVQHKETCATPVSFSSDSWETISCNIKKGNTSAYSLGDTKTVDLGTLGTQEVKIVNKSTPTVCSTTGYSQSACGFVLEFVDIVTERVMNNYSTSYGSWGTTNLRTYLNGDFYNLLPANLKNIVIDTSVVTGHNKYETDNVTSIDKIYLLTRREIWNFPGTGQDTATDLSRQLDLYESMGINPGSTTELKKKYNDSYYYWSLREVYYDNDHNFYAVTSGGSYYNYEASLSAGISPAFRIG